MWFTFAVHKAHHQSSIEYQKCVQRQESDHYFGWKIIVFYNIFSMATKIDSHEKASI